ncbi:NUDIX domain-containing protein [Arsenicicoccus piscis]|uniref:NUDIX hydrolase n=1 Tax=Arsenicicoccus piscis TaxID=673954 RepID=UPI001F4D278B|nr:NUDIX domain-containing protein [Arsenicicoccus piscis]MCH8627719.1 NUDIX domain-containing protein [Arsenicicoccus piscis]
MPIPPFVVALRRHVGHAPLWLAGVTAVVLRGQPESDLEVLLVQRSDTGEWGPVTGIIEPGEEAHVSAEREVLEEAGVVAEVERLVWVSSGPLEQHPNGDQAQYLDHTFRMRAVGGEPRRDGDETLAARWFSVYEMPPLRASFRSRIICAVADEPECRLGH